MICVSLSATDNASMFEQMQLAAQQPVAVYALRLDTMREDPEVERLVTAADRPVCVACRSRTEGGEFDGDFEKRRSILLRAVKAGAAYIEAEPGDVRALAPHKGEAILIAAFRDLRRTPPDLEKHLCELARLPADWISFAVTVRHPGDNLVIFEAIAASPKPCIGIGLGEEGSITRILGPALGSKMTYGELEREPDSSPALPTVRELAEVYRVGEIGESTHVYGVLGFPLGCCRAPELFNRGFQELGLDAVYVPFQTQSAENFFNTIPQGIYLKGLSVATPHKLAALAWADSASEAARRIGAANTLTLRPDGWRADNMECLVLFDALKRATDAAGITLTNAPALVMGSGATARAIGVAFTLLGCRVTVAGRLEDRTKRLAYDMNWEAENWKDAGYGAWQAVGNGTPVGMAPDVDATPFPSDAWRPGMFAFDAVHQPRETRFMRDARAAGAFVMDMEDMLQLQVAAQFRMWTGLALPPYRAAQKHSH